VKEKLIKILGGHTKDEMLMIKSEHESEILQHQSELSAYKEFTKSAYQYIGSYPAWKAQQEYRESMMNLGFPISAEINEYPTNEQNIDIYLGKIVDSFVILFSKVENQFGYNDLWEKEVLTMARGVDYLLDKKSKVN